MDVYSFRGERVCRLEPNSRESDPVIYVWRGSTGDGDPVVAGLYWLALDRGDERLTWIVRYTVRNPALSAHDVPVVLHPSETRSIPRSFLSVPDEPRRFTLSTSSFSDETEQRLPALADDTARLAAADVDGDDDLDVLIAEFGTSNPRNRIWINGGKGFFTDETDQRLPMIEDNSNDLALADIDGDEDLDVVIANGFENDSYILLNDGTGRFAHRPDLLPDSFNNSWGVRFCDVTGDSLPDLVFANIFGRNRLFENDGSGSFTDVSETHLPEDSDDTYEVCCADVNGDGANDIIFLNLDPESGLQNRLLINDGTGTFRDSTSVLLPEVSNASFDGETSDVDGDQLLDIVVADKWIFPPLDWTGSLSDSGWNRVQINESEVRPGLFTDETEIRMPALFEWTNGMDIGDVDGENGPDLLFANADFGAGARNRLHLNNGGGFFSDVTETWLPPLVNPSADIVAADLDGDGDLDVLVGNFSSGTKLWVQEAQNRLLINQTITGIGDYPAGPAVPQAFKLSQNYPNPFNPATTFDIDIPPGGVGYITLRIYTLRGQLVRTLEEARLPPGRHRYTWNGRGDDGERQPSGVYLLRLASSEAILTRKMLLVE
jgi:hypothetical protein